MTERTEEIKELTVEFCNNLTSAHWQRHAKFSIKSVERFIEIFPRPKILDLGCGGARDSVLFRAMGLQPICVDLSEVMCEAAKKEKLPVAIMDQENLAFQSESFDGVWARFSLFHSPPETMPEIVKNLRRLLKPSGVLFLAMKASIGQFIETELKSTENGSTYYCYWPPYHLRQVLDNAGFSVEDLLIKGKDFFQERNYFEIFAIKE